MDRMIFRTVDKSSAPSALEFIVIHNFITFCDPGSSYVHDDPGVSVSAVISWEAPE